MTTEPEKTVVDENNSKSPETPGDQPPQNPQTVETKTVEPPKRKILIGSQLGDDESAPKKHDAQSNVVPAVKSSDSQPDLAKSSDAGETANSETNEESSGTGEEAKPDRIQSALRNSSDVTAEEEAQISKAARVASNPPKMEYTIPSASVVDDEIDQMLEGVSMDSLITGDKIDGELEMDSRIKGTVDKIHNENIFFNLKGRFVGVASARNFKELPEPGAMLDVVVKSFNNEDGFYVVSVPGTSVDVADWSDLTPGAIVEVKVTGSNTGGLECTINNIRGFIPASQIEIFRVENFGDYVGKKLQCVVIEANEGKRKLVVSHRAIAEREREELKKELMETLQVGDLREGTVTKLMDFGAFVDIGGAEGLVHISKLSWDRVGHPSEVVKEGERISVKIEKINSDTGKIGLSFRDTMEHPWKSITTRFAVNSTVTGTVSKLADFGAFVKLEPGIEGLIHISEIAHHRVVAVKTHLTVGDEVQVKVLSVDEEGQKIGLSIKDLLEKPVRADSKKDKEEDEPLREAAIPMSNEPLKGGTQKKTGGEDFGLNW